VARQEIACDPCDPQERTLRALRRGVRAANRAVIERATWEMPLRGMGSTLVAVRIEGSHATFIHVGDSRAYLARGGVVTQITEDHSVVAEQVRLGLMGEDDAERSPMRSVITRAIGAEVDVQPELSALDLQADDALLLVSDGLTRHLGREDIALVLHQETGAQLACERMIALANERGGSDNVTCVLLRFLEENVS
jgi:serine/threonine protein phosphatase PrpC